MRKTLLVILMFTGSSMAEEPFGAIETRPIWERPSSDLTLQQSVEEAVDRGNGRVVDEATFELRRIERARAVADDVARSRDWFWQERERALQLDRVQRQTQRAQEKQRVMERESQRLKEERERWLRMINKPRHGEAAVVDRQMRDKVKR